MRFEVQSSKLPVIYREIILLSDVENASYREMAEILSIPMGTVMSRLARARKVVCESLRRNFCAPTARDLAHPIETHEKCAGVAQSAKKTAAYERRVHRSEFSYRKTRISNPIGQA
jgi:Sigma-70, region 4